MRAYEAPAKVNLALLVRPPSAGGLHPIESLVQTIEWVDRLSIDEADEDRLVVEKADIDPEANLVARALVAVRGEVEIPPLAIELVKEIPEEAGLGGGSSDAAATILAASHLRALPAATMSSIAQSIGSDVPLFLTGGTLMVSGAGEVIDRQPDLDGFALAVAVPPHRLATAAVYRRWDEMEGPVGEAIARPGLPPELRDGIPIRNDLTPAAIELEPELADFISDLRLRWGVPVAMTGSGSACFGFFPNVDEAEEAAAEVAPVCRAARGVGLRSRGVARAEA